MSYAPEAQPHERWAHLRFSIVGPLLAAPPPAGQLQEERQRLAAKEWLHPITAQPVRFGVSTIERWYYAARAAKTDPVGVLRRQVRKDCGQHRGLDEESRRLLQEQYQAHPRWSYQLHFDNLLVQLSKRPQRSGRPSYSTVRRYMKSHGLRRQRLTRSSDTPGLRRAEERRAMREVRSYESEYVHGLWHLDFHHGSHKILTAQGDWIIPILLAILDDHSRLICHAQWYCSETVSDLIHGLCQAFLKRGLPRSLLTDNGSAMIAAETTQGLQRLGIVHQTTLPASPYQNGKQESFFGQVEGRLLAMLDHCSDLTLTFLNDATQAWVEREYQRAVHSETGQPPIERFLQSPNVGRPCPSPEDMRLAFCQQTTRRQRRSDGTLTLDGIRFEIPARFRHFGALHLRYASWDLSHVYMTDPRSGQVLVRLYPLDRARNADGRRRSLEKIESPAPAAASIAAADGVAPLLRQLIEEYSATGLPPAYLPKTNHEEES